MKLGRKIRKAKAKILLFFRKYLFRKVYNFIIYQIAKNKFLKHFKIEKF